MNCLLTINVGGYLCENARESLLNAAERWHADYVEVTHNSKPNLLPCFIKAETLARLCHYDRIAYFDGDMLIRWDCPNCFEIFTESEKLYAVRDCSSNRLEGDQRFAYDVIGSVRTPYFEPLRASLGLDVPREHYMSLFFNSGFLLCSPKHQQDLLTYIESQLPAADSAFASNGHYEQALLNFAVQALCPDRLELVDETWNWIDPILEDNKMQAFVYHFTGANSRALKRALRTFNWEPTQIECVTSASGVISDEHATTLNSVFKRIYCINLDRRPDRWRRMLGRFENLKVSCVRVRAVDGGLLNDVPSGFTPEGFGCFLSHRRLLEDAVAANLDPFLVVEDDAEFATNFNDQFPIWFNGIPDDWELLYLGVDCLGPIKRLGRNMARVNRGLSSHAFGIRLHTAKDLLQMLRSETKQIDKYLMDIQLRGTSYCPVPFLAWQETGFSDLQQRIVSWGRCMNPPLV